MRAAAGPGLGRGTRGSPARAPARGRRRRWRRARRCAAPSCTLARGRRRGRAGRACVPPQLNMSASLAGGRVTRLAGAAKAATPRAATQISLLGVPAARARPARRQRLAHGRPRRPAARLLAGGRRQLRADAAVRRRRDGERSRALLAEGAGTHPGLLELHGRRQGHGPANRPGSTPARADARRLPELPLAPGPAPADGDRHDPRAQTSRGDLFIAPYSGAGPVRPDDPRRTRWADVVRAASPAGARAADLRVQSYEARPVLTWWQDPLVAGGSRKAGGVIADSSYRQIAVVRAGNGYQADLHEFQLTPQRHGADHRVRRDRLRPARGRRPARRRPSPTRCSRKSTCAPVSSATSGTSSTTWRCRAPTTRRRRASLDDAVRLLPHQLDRRRARRRLAGGRAQHVGRLRRRSAQRPGPLAARRASTAASSSGPGTRTAWQHDAREQPDGAITFFDNGATPTVHPESRAIEVALDTPTGRATLVRSYEHRNPLRRRQPGQRAGARRRRLDGRLGAGAATSREVEPRRPAAVRRAPAAGLGDLPHLRAALERAPAAPPAVARERGRRRRGRATRAGTGRPRWPPGACSPAPRASALAPLRERAAERASRRRSRCRAAAGGPLRRGAGARRARRRHRRRRPRGAGL